jgi:serine/threonine protein kinase
MDRKFADFGVLKVMSSSARVEQSVWGGTLHYIAPEVLMGEKHCPRNVGIYSFGVTTCAILTGLPLFTAEGYYRHIIHIINERQPPQIPPSVREPIARLMEPFPREEANVRQDPERHADGEFLWRVDTDKFRDCQRCAAVRATQTESISGSLP